MISALSLRTPESSAAPSSGGRAVTQQGLGPVLFDGGESLYLLPDDALSIVPAPKTKPAVAPAAPKAPAAVGKARRASRVPSRACQDTLGEDGAVLGRYQLLHCLARDARGASWRAKDGEGKAEVLLHLVAAGAANRERALQAKARGLAAAGVQHPGLERVRDVTTTESGAVMIVVSAPRGISLRQLLQARGGLDAAEAAPLIAQVASALAVAHGAGLRHGAVTPEAIMVRRDPRGVVHAAIGGLAAPIERALVSEADDVRALCEVLRALLGARGERDNGALHQLLDEARWTTMSSLAAALDAFLRGEASASTQEAKPQHPSQPPKLIAPLPSYTPPEEHLLSALWRARSSLLLGAGTLMALLAIGATLATVSSRHAKATAPQSILHAAP